MNAISSTAAVVSSSAPTSIVGTAGTSSLASRAMLRAVKVSRWSGRKLDKAVSNEVNENKGSAANVARVNKRLLPPEALAKVDAAESTIRAIHDRFTLPWMDNGLAILPAESVMAYDAAMRKAREAFETATAEFLASYPDYVREAPARLGALYDATEFPSVRELQSKFSVRVRTVPLPDSDDFRVAMAESQKEEIRAEIQRDVQEAFDNAMRSAVERIAETVGRMAERLRSYKPAASRGEKSTGTFRDSLVENVRDLVEILPSFNLTGDAALAALTARMKAELCQHNAQELRDDFRAREEVARSAQSILDSVSEFLG